MMEAELRETPMRTGVTYPGVIPGWVSRMEERETAQEAQIPWMTWKTLPRSEKVEALAWRRARLLADLHGSSRIREQREERATLAALARKGHK